MKLSVVVFCCCRHLQFQRRESSLFFVLFCFLGSLHGIKIATRHYYRFHNIFHSDDDGEAEDHFRSGSFFHADDGGADRAVDSSFGSSSSTSCGISVDESFGDSFVRRFPGLDVATSSKGIHANDSVFILYGVRLENRQANARKSGQVRAVASHQQ